MSVFSKYKNCWIDSDKETHPSKKKYYPYHSRIQKKQTRFDQDWYHIDKEGSEKSLCTGINQNMHNFDFKPWHDREKGGN